MNNAIALLKRSIDVFSQNWKLFAGIAVLPGILSFAVGYGAEYIMIENGGLLAVTIVALQIALAVVGILMSIALLRAAMQPSISIGEAYRQSLPYFWWYLLLSIVVGIIVMLGLIVFIVPGIIFMVWFAFAYYALVVDDIRGFKALSYSKQLVSGRWWTVFGYMLFLLVISMLIGIVVGFMTAFLERPAGTLIAQTLNLLVTVFLTPVALIYFYLLYEKLKREPVESSGPAATPQTDTNAPNATTPPVV